MNKTDYLHEMKKIATLVRWVEERPNYRRRADFLVNKVLKRAYELLDMAYEYIPEEEEKEVPIERHSVL